jgi:16S rRNA (cytosine967-C5)-methyltransferase
VGLTIVKAPAKHRPKTQKTKPREEPAAPGLMARELATAVVDSVLNRHRGFDDAWARAESNARIAALEPRDRAFARAIAATVLRRLGSLDAVLAAFMERPLPAKDGRAKAILLCGAAQLLLLDTPAHAAISLAVDQCRQEPRTRRFDKLTNAVLRRVAREGGERLAQLPAALDIPEWLMARWRACYGDSTATAIAAASLAEAPLDLSVKTGAESWAERLGGAVLPTGSVRLAAGGRIGDLDGYSEGAWWVQDAAAALPARLLGDVAGLEVADLCAAPGGKTAELAAAGARVTAVDVSAERLKRVAENLARLKLDARLVVADATAWQPEARFDAVLVDAPCTATGTIRRHPDILRLRRDADIASLAETQRKILAHAATLVKPGGTLVYCTCSLEPEEGERQIDAFLALHPAFHRVAITPGEHGIDAGWIAPSGDLRTLPCHLAAERPELSGIDGFYAARLRHAG